MLPHNCTCIAKRSPHGEKNVTVWERTKPVLPTHTSLLCSLRTTPILPNQKRSQGLVPCQNPAHFHRQSQEGFFGKDVLHCCFWTEHLVHKHSAYKDVKHGNEKMGCCRAVGECFDQHMDFQLLTRQDLPAREVFPVVLHFIS